MELQFTRHASIRRQQRGISRSDLDLAFCFGIDTGSGILFRRREANAMIDRLKCLIRSIERARDTCIIADGEMAVTVYKARDRRARRRGKGED